MRSNPCLVLTLSLAAGTAAAQTAPYTEVSGVAGATASGGCWISATCPPVTRQDSNNLPDSISTQAQTQSVGAGASADSRWFYVFPDGDGVGVTQHGIANTGANATVTFGRIEALATATVDSGGKAVFTPTGEEFDNPFSGEASAHVNASFADVVTITEPGVAAGTPVDVQAGVYVHLASGGVTPFHGGLTSCGAALSANGAVGPLTQSFALTSCQFDPSLNVPPPPTLQVVEGVVHTFVGAQLNIRGAVSVAAMAAFGLEYPWSSVTTGADIRDTEGVFIDVLTPGASYISASGTVYDTAVPDFAVAVPEPSSLALLVAGLSLLYVPRRRRHPLTTR